MILTVTLNASIDKLYLMDAIHPETVMRVKEVHNTAGGKGLNVSKVASLLGEPVTAMGFTGGCNGQYLESLLAHPLIRPAFTHVSAETRSCINCWDLSNGRSTEYLEPGEPVTEEEVGRFLSDYERELPKAKVVSISGSAPKGVPGDYYSGLIRRAAERGIPVLIDTSGPRLLDAAGAKPFLLKPNEDEMAQLTGREVNTRTAEGRAEAVRALLDLRAGGIACAVLSLGAEGAILACDEGIFVGKPPVIRPRNTVGCGDSMVAGFAVGISRGLSMPETFRMALAVSAANALSLFTGDFDPRDYERLYPEVTIEKQ